MRTPDADETELLKLLAAEGRMDQADPRLNKFSDDKSTLSKPDTFNRCEDMFWIKSWHNHDASHSAVEITKIGRALIRAN